MLYIWFIYECKSDSCLHAKTLTFADSIIQWFSIWCTTNNVISEPLSFKLLVMIPFWIHIYMFNYTRSVKSTAVISVIYMLNYVIHVLVMVEFVSSCSIWGKKIVLVWPGAISTSVTLCYLHCFYRKILNMFSTNKLHLITLFHLLFGLL